MAIRQVALVINCGYARVSIFDNSNPKERGRYARLIDTKQRATKFREQFGSTFSLTDPIKKVLPNLIGTVKKLWMVSVSKY